MYSFIGQCWNINTKCYKHKMIVENSQPSPGNTDIQSDPCLSISISESRCPRFDPIWPVGDKERKSERGRSAEKREGLERRGADVVWLWQNQKRMRGSDIKKKKTASQPPPLQRARATIMLITSNEVNIQLLQTAFPPLHPHFMPPPWKLLQRAERTPQDSQSRGENWMERVVLLSHNDSW